MPETNTINVDILDNMIIGRVEPQIYAFTTQTIPNYLKVGDTYRPIETRLNEWRKHFPNLEKKFGNVAKVDDETFFRDYAVHLFLENELNRKRLGRDVFKDIPYYSNEFFENATEQDLHAAITDIKNGHLNNEAKYQYYRFDESFLPEKHTFKRGEIPLELRPNQKETVEKFKEAFKKDRTNLLMYAVMRFGKTFTSLCCAVEMNAKLVVVVSAKADVRGEWKKTVESLKNFEGYCFLESADLLRNELIIAEKQAANEKIVLFLTLQDLQGDAIKPKHAAIFKNEIDLLLIDETHFGARATEYGKVLKEENLSAKEIKSELNLNDNTLDDLEITNKVFNAKIRIHLSGTPYRILMNSEFTDEDIIAFYQFTDIAHDQEQWDVENLNKDEVKEWDNPYYGFPQMIRFAFNPNESSLKKMEELKKNGATYAFSELFRPQSITIDKGNNLHKKFIHQEEILDLLKVIDGSETDANLLSFLDYDKIKEGKMCRHLVCVLPYRASCDALEELIKNNQFKHLGQYEIINISGVENENEFKDTNASSGTEKVIDKIKKCESEGVKTITLTVNRMLTGSTVPQWDTMLYLKDTASPQEYDQAIFRLQNQYIKTYVDDKKDGIKYNMKPQTLLVDFNPTRMFVMQEEKAQIYNINTDTDGNLKLVERLKRELEVSPIIQLNKDKLVQVNPTDILNAVREYSSNRSVLDEAKVIPLDLSLLEIDEIRREIERQNEIGSNEGLKIKPHETSGEGQELDMPKVTQGGEGSETGTSKSKENEKDNDEASIRKKFASYYSRILFFAFCTEEKLMSLQEIIDLIETDEESKRIADNLELNINILKLLRLNIQHYVLSKLEYKIQNINHLANDASVEPVERASRAMKKFTRLSESEIVTPEIITDKMISGLPENAVENNTMLLDIASKQGEFVYAVYKKFGAAVANNFYSIPTSKTAYEFTRKVYKLLNLDVNQIEANYTSYDLISENNFIENETIKINNKEMKFNVIVGNPPYQQSDGGHGRSAAPIYHKFIQQAKRLNPNFLSLIVPSRWYAGGKGLDEFRTEMLTDKRIRKIVDFENSNDVFPGVDVAGGICYFLRDRDNQGLCEVVNFNGGIELNSERDLNEFPILIRQSQAVSIIRKINQLEKSKHNLNKVVSASKPFGIRGHHKPSKTGILCHFTQKQGVLYVNKEETSDRFNIIDKYKLLIPRAPIAGQTDFSKPIGFYYEGNVRIAKPSEICTESWIVAYASNSLDKVISFKSYLFTKTVRFLLLQTVVSQDVTRENFCFIPDLENYEGTYTDELLVKKWNIDKEEWHYIDSRIKAVELMGNRKTNE